jgi:hypothetical protein
MQQLLDKLVDAGLIKKNEQPQSSEDNWGNN